MITYRYLGLLFLVPLFVKSQTIETNGFIIALKGDTIQGKITINPNDFYVKAFHEVVFTDSTGTTTRFLPGQILGYSLRTAGPFQTSAPPCDFTDADFKSFKNVPVLGFWGMVRKDLFLMRKLLSIVSYYYYPHEMYDMKKRLTSLGAQYVFWDDHYLVYEDRPSTLANIASSNYTGEFFQKKFTLAVIKDCPSEISNKYPRAFNKEQFISLVQEYNRWRSTTSH